MRSLAFLGGVCAFFAFASSVTAASLWQNQFPVLTPSEIFSYWVDNGDDWGLSDCNPAPRDIHDILDCTHGEGFSGTFVEIGYQDISGSFSFSNGLGWVAGYPMFSDGWEIQSIPTFDDFFLYYQSASSVHPVLPSFHVNALSWTTNDSKPFRFFQSQYISNVSSHVVFNWRSCPVVTRAYFGVNYAPRWWADGLQIGVVDYATFLHIFPNSDFPEPPWINVPSSRLEEIFTNSIHFTFREGWR